MRIPTFKSSFLAMIAIPASLLVACGNNENINNAGNYGVDTTANTGMINNTDGTNNPSGTNAKAVLSGTHADTSLTGTASFQENGGRVIMNLDITAPKMANKTVAVHIHEHGSCGDMGKEAHGHWNPTSMPHGKWGEGQFHRGDIGNISLDATGRGTMQLDTDLWSISDSDTTRNIINKAIIVHGGADDYKTQPTGGAGSRLGCGVITRM